MANLNNSWDKRLSLSWQIRLLFMTSLCAVKHILQWELSHIPQNQISCNREILAYWDMKDGETKLYMNKSTKPCSFSLIFREVLQWGIPHPPWNYTQRRKLGELRYERWIEIKEYPRSDKSYKRGFVQSRAIISLEWGVSHICQKLE